MEIFSSNGHQYYRQLCTQCGVFGQSESVTSHELVHAQLGFNESLQRPIIIYQYQCPRCGYQKEHSWIIDTDSEIYISQNYRPKDNKKLGRHFVDEDGIKRVHMF